MYIFAIKKKEIVLKLIIKELKQEKLLLKTIISIINL
jgi:hypothetical protein